jgi:uncharacterized protein (DUF1800 family)
MSLFSDIGKPHCAIFYTMAQRFRLVLSLLLVLSTSSLLAEEGQVTFFTDQTEADLGTTRIIPFNYSVKNTYTVHPTSSSFDTNIAEVVKEPTILPGYQIGYLRILAKSPGETRLNVGDSSISVKVIAPLNTNSLTNTSPAITEPVDGATVWGMFYLTVELPNKTPSQFNNARIDLALEDGTLIPSSLKFKESTNSLTRYVLKLNLNAFNSFKVRLHPVIHLADGTDLAGDSISLQPIAASSADIAASGQCSRFTSPLRELDFQKKTQQANAAAGNKINPPNNLPVDYSPTASSGFAVKLLNGGLKWSFPVSVQEDGYYQLMLNLSSGKAYGGYASLGVYVDGKNEALTTSRIASTQWHRIPAGKPFKLTAGDRIVSIGLLNQIVGAKKENRNLYLDRFELVRLGDYKPVKDVPTQVYFEQVVDQLAVSGTVTIKGHVIGDEIPKDPKQAPKVVLLINDQPALTQSGANPTFQVSPAAFRPGTNEIQLEAVTKDNFHYRSLTQTLVAKKIPSNPDTPPSLTILYPPANHHSAGIDAVVVSAFDPSGIKRIDLQINGVEQKLNLSPSLGLGSVTLPLVLKNKTDPGPVAVSVIAESNSGQRVELPVNGFVYDPASPPEQDRYSRAVHLLNRLAYGPNSRDISSILTLGENAWLQQSLTASPDDTSEKIIMEQAMIEFPDSSNARNVVARVLDQALKTDNPLRTRFVFWLNNHFSTWIRKTEAEPKWQEYLAWNDLGPTLFNNLLNASSHSPAMLIYLDQQRSYAGRINENYAREIMELHTLGVNGGYTQSDVTKLARLFTGLTIATDAFPDGRSSNGNNGMEKQFYFSPNLNDISAQEILGLSFTAKTPQDQYDRIAMALELLSAHPSTANFIAKKFGEHYIGINVSDAAIKQLATVFLQTNGDMRAMISALPQMPEFWQSMKSPRVTTPLDYGIRLARAANLTQPQPVIEYLERSGMGVFDRATPDGYPENDSNYANSNSLLQRWQLARRLENNLLALVPKDWRQPAVGVPDNKNSDNQWENDLIDLLSAELIGQPLSPNSKQAALDVLKAPANNENNKVLRVVTFISQLPEYNLR